MDDEDYVCSVIVVDNVLDAHLCEGSTDNVFDEYVELHNDFDRMAAFQA